MKTARSARRTTPIRGLLGAGAALVVMGSAASMATASDLQTIRSRPDLKPPKIKVGKLSAGIAPGLVLLTPRAGKPGQAAGPMLLDGQGRVRWYHPLPDGRVALNFEAQRYGGRPVLTWSERQVIRTKDGTPVIYDTGAKGKYNVIANSRYSLVKRIRAVGKGVYTDLHESKITRAGNMLVVGYRFVPRDLRSVGGPANGRVIDNLIQVISIKTGKVAFNWHSLYHVSLKESYLKPQGSGAWDYFHVNSLDVDGDGNLLVSARHTSTVYKVSIKSGKTMWRLGGKRSSFKMGKGSRFYYQHDARRTANGTISIFDNHAADFDRRAKQSRVIRLRVDAKKRTATLTRSYEHGGKGVLAVSQGGARVLANGNLFVGWGSTPYFSEFAPDGTLLFDARLPSAAYQSYRAFRYPWRGTPRTRPALAASRSRGVVNVYASWNGATEVVGWRVLAGPRATSLAAVGEKAWGNLETRIPVTTAQAYVAVQALGASGKVLATSRAIKPKSAG